MKKIVPYVLLGLAAYVGFLVWTFPAQRAMSMVQAQVPQLRVAGVTGSAWSGRASMLQFEGQNFQRFKWQFSPLGLFVGRIEFDLSFDGDGRSADGVLGLRSDGAVVFNDVSAKLPIADIGQHLELGIVSLKGLVELQLEELVLMGNKPLSAEGLVYWRQAALETPVAQKLGDYSAVLTTDDAGIKVQLKDEGGPLQLDGSVQLVDDGAFSVNVMASVRDPKERMLHKGLQTIGEQQPDGRYALKFNGKL